MGSAARIDGNQKGEGKIGVIRHATHDTWLDQALVKLNGGKDLGPDAKADAAERKEAMARWREWWAGQESR